MIFFAVALALFDAFDDGVCDRTTQSRSILYAVFIKTASYNVWNSVRCKCEKYAYVTSISPIFICFSLFVSLKYKKTLDVA